MSEAIFVRPIPRTISILAGAFLLAVTFHAQAATNFAVVGWNNLGMHCMDADFSVFAILPPYNTVNAQLIDASGHLVTDATDLSLTY